MKIRILLKSFVMFSLAFLVRIFRYRKYKNNLRVLIFHNINEINIQKFENLINSLSKNWNFVTPHQFDLFMRNKLSLKGNNLLITFDDGFKSSYKAIKNVLEPKSIKSIVFIATNFISCGNNQKKCLEFILNNLKEKNFKYSFVDELFPMDFRDMADLKLNGNIIGSHTCSHINLIELSKNKLISELILSKKFLEQELSIKISEFAYPYGNENSISSSIYHQCLNNYARVYSGCRGNNKPGNNFIFRDTITLDEPLFYVNVYLSGILDSFHKKKFNKII